ncbi:DUF885 domain-containing protein [bacterium CPR1]|nr:DUF885 domain-containing protein [bacterium CPR1]
MRRFLTICLVLCATLAARAQSPDPAFVQLAERYVDEWLALSPEAATSLGEHRFDGRLTDYSPAGIARSRELASRYLEQLKEIDPGRLSIENQVDYEIMKTSLEYSLFSLDKLQEHLWNPLTYNPGAALYALMARDYAPLPARVESLAQRLDAIDPLLQQARENLENPPRIHTETAIAQNKGALSFVEHEIDTFLNGDAALTARLAPHRQQAAIALRTYGDWLEHDLLPRSKRDFRLGDALYRQKLRFALESDLSKEEILRRAEAELKLTHQEMARTARPLYERAFPGRPVPADQVLIKAVLDRLAQDRPDNQTIVDQATRDLEETTNFVRMHNLVSVPDDPLEVMVMPEFARGVAVAYCDSSGPLEKKPSTFYAISPTPSDWKKERVESFFREYNDSMLKNLTVHEAMPGHYLQVAHANRFKAPTRVRVITMSGTFVEGWATYAEQVMVGAGYGGPEVKMQQLKMRLRLIINSILDQKVHTAGMTETEALKLMMEDGFQEEGEAAGKWRRACLSSTQLSTYFVGNLELNDIVRAYEKRSDGKVDLKAMHDQILSFGSPAPKFVKRLMGL